MRPGVRVVLVDGRPTPEPDLMTWALQVEADPVCRIALDEVDSVAVSTVFRWITDMAGCAFETMTFGPERWDCQCWRWATLDDARAGHARIVEAVRSGADPDTVET